MNCHKKKLILILSVGFFGSLFLALNFALASFNDQEASSGNLFGAGVLDIKLEASEGFLPPTPGEPNRLVRQINIINQGNLNFRYQIRVGEWQGEFCKALQISANLNGGEVECPTSSLTSFQCGPFEASSNSENWEFVASFSGYKFFPASCKFTLVVDAWQDNFSFLRGFSDQERIENEIKKHYSEIVPELNIVINEFLPNPVGPDDAEKPNGEWVELYNKGEVPVHLKGWFLMDLQGKKLAVPEATIAPKGFLVVYLDGKYHPGWLNNSGKDGVSLWAPRNPRIPPKRCVGFYCLIDAHAYCREVPEGKSFARVPDGSKNWYDPLPTPGAPNQLSPNESSLEPETSEISEEEVFQLFMTQLSGELSLNVNQSKEISSISTQSLVQKPTSSQPSDENSTSSESLSDENLNLDHFSENTSLISESSQINVSATSSEPTTTEEIVSEENNSLASSSEVEILDSTTTQKSLENSQNLSPEREEQELNDEVKNEEKENSETLEESENEKEDEKSEEVVEASDEEGSDEIDSENKSAVLREESHDEVVEGSEVNSEEKENLNNDLNNESQNLNESTSEETSNLEKENENQKINEEKTN